MTKPDARHGALVGAMLTAAFISVSLLGWAAFGLPFLPFDLFDWTSRVLPGSAVTTAVDSIVAVSRLIGGSSLSEVAKPLEQAIAVLAMLLLGTVGGAVLFALLRLPTEPALLLSAIVGAILGGLALVAEHQLDRIATGPAFSGPWVFATVCAWSLAFGWTHDRLSGVESGLGGPPVVGVAGRRRFLLQLGGSTFITTIVSTAAGMLFLGRTDSLAGTRWSDTHALPNADAPVKPVAGTRPEFTPIDRHYRVDTNTRAPRIDVVNWRLRIGGMVQRPLAFTLDELRLYEPIHEFATLSCISNPPGGDLISTTRWTGVSLRRLLQAMVVDPAATHLRITSADGFFETVALAAIRGDERIMLAYAWDGVPLPAEHGFPLRAFIPDLYGMKQPKWVVAIDAVDRWQPGYWVARGWDREGRVAVASAIDAVNPISDVSGASGSAVEMGGMAFAGSRGVSRVEVRADEGEWQAAELRAPMSEATWVLWRARLAVGPGRHVLAVRARDGAGRLQDSDFHIRRYDKT
jgi:DMSO/TMAO reductase YedYZ molybdopterin-dependent catalytic subunit